MYVYESYYVLIKKGSLNYFLTEDKTYTKQLERSMKFSSWDEALKQIEVYKEIEEDEFYSGDFIVHNELEAKKIETSIN